MPSSQHDEFKLKKSDDATPSQEKLRVLHLFGSEVSEYYSIVSIKYAAECAIGTTSGEGNCGDAFEYVYARVHPTEPRWSFPEGTSEDCLAKAKRVSNSEAIRRLAEMNIDVCVPHMFCYPGMTTYRSLMDFLNIPFVGNTANAMALTTHKGQTRAILSAAGVRVPKGELLVKGRNTTPNLPTPYILKPCREDNSMGVTLVRCHEESKAGLDIAFKFDDEVLCEEYVPLGRELRIGAIEDENGNVVVLPCIEYHLPKENPIRASTDKLTVDRKGLPNGFAKPVTSCPAKLSKQLERKLSDMVQKAHKALGCRDYSLYDVRVSPEDEPYFLEAGLYCSFSPRSVVVNLAKATGEEALSYHNLYRSLVTRAAERHVQNSGQTQALGMMRR
mmetsp:Transcript_29064/g.70895  ORF Transcript_29064/g.70895 Transcript_29064/m.70895 type:complete len:388 (-) Transcript_29064:279-1442(-)|eukprot:CAMPEP_0114498266 /NCGR_PEP_ID=MMETSP0109-20121206/6786_1 /TAXON_ID=29199 /ORGANISM="Chlorarachnion reptans, Strain CCCM449" /LENGTH=387 /DNA_ID=CAMNT_0001675743 /DNA_START=154 /DNA_END=1317 /DNA_ORIENTATION=+